MSEQRPDSPLESFDLASKSRDPSSLLALAVDVVDAYEPLLLKRESQLLEGVRHGLSSLESQALHSALVALTLLVREECEHSHPQNEPRPEGNHLRAAEETP